MSASGRRHRRLRAGLPLPLAAVVLAAACGGDPAIRDDAPEHLVEDLARALQPHAVAWQAEQAAAPDDPAARALRLRRLIERGRQLCDPWLPREVRRIEVPDSWSPRLGSLLGSLASVEPERIAATVAASASARRERRVILDLDGEAWSVRLRPVNESWEFVSAPTRVRP